MLPTTTQACDGGTVHLAEEEVTVGENFGVLHKILDEKIVNDKYLLNLDRGLSSNELSRIVSRKCDQSM